MLCYVSYVKLCQANLDEDNQAMVPLRGFLHHMMNHYPMFNDKQDGTCRDDFASLHTLVSGSQNPSLVIRCATEVRAAAKEKQSPRVLLATFGAFPQGRRLLDMASTKAQTTMANLQHIGRLDGVISKAQQIKTVVLGVASNAAALSKVIDASIQLVDELLSAQKDCVAAAQDQVIDTQDNQTYSTTVCEAQEALVDLIRGIAEKHVVIEAEPWLKNQLSTMRETSTFTLASKPEFKISCFSNVNLKKLGSPIQEIPDLLSFYTASADLKELMETCAVVMGSTTADHAEKQRTNATQLCMALQTWIEKEKALTVSFRRLHACSSELKEALTLSVSKVCLGAWGRVMAKPSETLWKIVSIGWAKPSLDMEKSDISAISSACSDACLLATGTKCAADTDAHSEGPRQLSTPDLHTHMCNAAEFVKLVVEASGKVCDANACPEQDLVTARLAKAHAMKLIHKALVKVGLVTGDFESITRDSIENWEQLALD